MRLTQNEVKEAIREWLSRRGVSAPENEITFNVVANGCSLANGILYTDVQGVELPANGPYR